MATNNRERVGRGFSSDHSDTVALVRRERACPEATRP